MKSSKKTTNRFIPFILLISQLPVFLTVSCKGKESEKSIKENLTDLNLPYYDGVYKSKYKMGLYKRIFSGTLKSKDGINIFVNDYLKKNVPIKVEKVEQLLSEKTENGVIFLEKYEKFYYSAVKDNGENKSTFLGVVNRYQLVDYFLKLKEKEGGELWDYVDWSYFPYDNPEKMYGDEYNITDKNKLYWDGIYKSKLPISHYQFNNDSFKSVYETSDDTENIRNFYSDFVSKNSNYEFRLTRFGWITWDDVHLVPSKTNLIPNGYFVVEINWYGTYNFLETDHDIINFYAYQDYLESHNIN